MTADAGSFVAEDAVPSIQAHRDSKLAILGYMNRSGSTFLAKELDRLTEVRVTLEATFPFSKSPARMLQSPKELNAYMNSLFEDPKFRAWEIPRSLIETVLENVTYPLGLRNILEHVVPLIAKQDDYNKIVVYKSGRLPFREGFCRTFKDVPVIFIDRDPRGIFASQKQSFGSLTKKPMLADIVRFAISYKMTHKKVEERRDDWLIVRYENLINGVDKELLRIAQYLGVDHSSVGDSDYYNRIPREQIHLHANIDKSPDPSRLDSWQRELSRSEIFFLQEVLGKEITKGGYKFVYRSKLTVTEQTVVYNWKLRFMVGLNWKTCTRKAKNHIKHFRLQQLSE